jgi:PQQ-dependent catabolism-associated beta-propeller protein
MQFLTGRGAALLALAVVLGCVAVRARASELFVSNEVDDTVTVLNGETYKVIATIPTDQRPRGIVVTPDDKAVLVCDGDSSNIDVIDTKTLKVTRRIDTGPDPETLAMSPSGDEVYVSNENNALVTVINYATGKWITQIPVGIEPEGLDTKTWQLVANVLVDTRPRIAQYTRDQRYLWVSSEVGGTVSVIDPRSHQIVHVIDFHIPGVDREYIGPVGVQVTPDGRTAFVALGRANRVAVVDAHSYEVEKYILVGQRPWQIAFSPHYRRLFVVNGLTNDVTIIDVSSLEATKSAPVGRLPWGIAVVP